MRRMFLFGFLAYVCLGIGGCCSFQQEIMEVNAENVRQLVDEAQEYRSKDQDLDEDLKALLELRDIEAVALAERLVEASCGDEQ